MDSTQNENNKPQPNTDSGSASWPPVLILLFLLIIVFLSALSGAGLILAVSQMMGLSLQDAILQLEAVHTPVFRNFVRLITSINHLTTFIIPALLLAYIIYRKDWSRQLLLHRRPGILKAFMGCLWLLAAFPLVQYIYYLNKQLPLPEWMVTMEHSTDELVLGLMIMNSPWELLFNLLVVALIPAIGEELIFRGLVQQQLSRWYKNPVVGVWVAAFVFSAVHMQFEGFLSRVLLGALLGYLLLWTRNLWVPVIAHFFNNAVQIVIMYFAGKDIAEVSADRGEPVAWWFALFSLALVISIGNYLAQDHVASNAAASAGDSASIQDDPVMSASQES